MRRALIFAAAVVTAGIVDLAALGLTLDLVSVFR